MTFQLTPSQPIPPSPGSHTSEEHEKAPAHERYAWTYWLPSGYFLLHSLEELPGFAEWTSLHFGAMSTTQFALSHVPMLWLAFLASHGAALAGRHGAWTVLIVAAQWQFGLNAIFHLVTAALFGEYSPGMLTAAAVGLPLTAYFLGWIWREGRLTGRELAASIGVGTLIAGAAIAALFFH